MTRLSRALPESDYLALKAAARALVRDVGGLEAAAMVTRVSAAQLGHYQSPHTPHFMPADVAADLEREATAPHVTRRLAQLAGCLLIPLPLADADPEWAGHLGRIAKECGEAMGRLGEALSAGGTVTADEVRELRLLEEVREAMESLAACERALQALVAGNAQPAVR